MVRYYRLIVIHMPQKMKKLMKEDLIMARRRRRVRRKRGGSMSMDCLLLKHID